MQLAAGRYATHAVVVGGDPTSTQHYERIKIPAVDLGLALHLKPTGKYVARPVRCGPDEYRAFLGALQVAAFRSKKDIIGKALSVVSDEVVGQQDGESLTQPDERTAMPPATSSDPIALVADAFPGAEMPQPAYEWLKERAGLVKTADPAALKVLADLWPEDVPTFGNTDFYTEEEADLILPALKMAERAAGMEFPEPRPGVDLLAQVKRMEAERGQIPPEVLEACPDQAGALKSVSAFPKREAVKQAKEIAARYRRDAPKTFADLLADEDLCVALYMQGDLAALGMGVE